MNNAGAAVATARHGDSMKEVSDSASGRSVRVRNADADAGSNHRHDPSMNAQNGITGNRNVISQSQTHERERESDPARLNQPASLPDFEPVQSEAIPTPRDEQRDRDDVSIRFSAQDLQIRIQAERDRLKNKRDQLHQLRIETIDQSNHSSLTDQPVQAEPPMTVGFDSKLDSNILQSNMAQSQNSVPSSVLFERATSSPQPTDEGGSINRDKDDDFVFDSAIPQQIETVSTTPTHPTNSCSSPRFQEKAVLEEDKVAINKGDEAKKVAEKEKKKEKKKSFMSTLAQNRAVRWVIIIMGLAVFTIALVLVDKQTEQAEKEKEASSATSSPSSSDTCNEETHIFPDCICQEELADPLPPEVAYNRPRVLDYLILEGLIENTTSFYEDSLSCTMQNQALVWVSNLKNHPNASIPTNLQLLQRYVLAIVYQQLSGNGWTSSNGWMDGQLSECIWEGIQCSSTAKNIMELNLADKNLKGSLPFLELGELESLRQFSVSQNRNLTGTLPLEITTLPLLQFLDLSGTSISGPLPTQYGERLAELHASSASLNGTIPSQLGSMKRLRILELSQNNITGRIPSELLILPELEEFDVSSNQLEGNLPAIEWQCPFLDILKLDDNAGLSGPYPEPTSSMLTFVNFAGTSLTGTVPNAYCNLAYLESVLVDCEGGIDNESDLDCACCQCSE